MIRLVYVLLFLSSCSAKWHCGEDFISGMISYGMAFGNQEINSCCHIHDTAYAMAECFHYERWSRIRRADEEMLRCMTRNDRGIWRSAVSYSFYGACRVKNFFCELTNFC